MLGLDVGSHNIKVALVKRSKRRRHVLDVAVLKTPDGSILDGAIIYMDAIVGTIKAYIEKSGIKPNGLAVSINSPDIITRNLSLPALPIAEIPAAVKLEILKLFPSIKESHEISQRIVSSDATGISVLAALCPLDLLKEYRVLADQLDLPYRYADVRADAQAKAIEFFYGGGGNSIGDRVGATLAATQGDIASGETAGSYIAGGETTGGRHGVGDRVGAALAAAQGDIAGSKTAGSHIAGGGTTGGITSGPLAGLLIDIGYRNSLVSIISQDKLVLSRYIMCGTSLYDNMVAEKTGVDRDVVEAARLCGDFSNVAMDSAEAVGIIDVCFSEIIDQIRQTAELYMDNISDTKLSYIMVVGEGAMIPGIEEHFADIYGLIPRELKPTPKGVSDGRALMQNPNPKLLFAAVGAALAPHEFDFLYATTAANGSFARGAAGRIRGGASGRLLAASLAALMIAAISIVVGLYFVIDQRRNTIEIDRINLEISNDAQMAEYNDALNSARAKLSTLNAILDSIDEQSMRASELLEQLTDLAPESLFVVNFNMIDANNAVMSGRAKYYDSVADFASILRQSNKLSSVRINTITANQSVSDAYTDYGFTLTITKRAGY